MRQRYEQFTSLSRKVAIIESIEELLSWDQETQMPDGAESFRAEQRSLVAGMAHELSTSSEMGDLLAELSERNDLGDLGISAVANVREWKRRYERDRRVPTRLVKEITEVIGGSHRPWVEARRTNNYSLFAPYLDRLIRLKREWAQAVGGEGYLYDALLDEYEPGASSESISTLLGSLRERLVTLVRRIQTSSRQPDSSFITGEFSPAIQKTFGAEVSARLGFSFEKGRLDTSAHPFCTGICESDVRMTTRYDVRAPMASLFGIIHETGHGLYEQGLLQKHRGTPAGSAISLGIHESQSRWWENCIGRSRPFWQFFLPLFKESFSSQLKGVSLEDFVFFINRVSPSLIRVEADEVTYNLHILLRTELEQALFNAELSADELPSAWNDKMEEYLGIRPTSDSDGVLQDIHWSIGAFGYFPTYALGNLYASQLDDAIRRDIGDVDSSVAQGDFSPLLTWMRDQVHRHGGCFSADMLIEKATGQAPDSSYFLEYLERKYGELYGLS